MKKKELITRTIVFGMEAVAYIEEHKTPADKAEEVLESEGIAYGISTYSFTEEQWEACSQIMADLQGWDDYMEIK